MDSWAGYAAVSYGQRVDGFQPYCGQGPGLQPYCGQTSGLQPYCGQASLQPTYDPVFPALLHQKATYARHDTDDWPRHHPFGVLPHEAAAAAFPFPPQNPSLNPHQVTGRRSPSTHDVSPSYFQTNFPPTDPLQKLSDYPSRLYTNLQQPNESPLKDYRSYSRQDCDRIYEKPEPIKKPIDTDALSRLYPSLQPQTDQIAKEYRFQSPDQEQLDTDKKNLEVSDHREYSQSSPISFAIMDQRMRSPQFQQNSFRYSSVSTPDEFQRSKSSESFSSSLDSDCSQRPTVGLQQNTANYVYNQNDQSVDPSQRYSIYSSNRFDNDFRQNYAQRDVQRTQYDNQSSCRGDPMSLVRNLHNTPEKSSEKVNINRDGVVEELLREPPPAHNQNYNFEFERWNLTITQGSKVVFNQNNSLSNEEPQSLVLPGVQYFSPKSCDSVKDKVKPSQPSIEQELAYLLNDEKPLEIKFTPKISPESILKVFNNFVKGIKEETQPIVKKVPTIPVIKNIVYPPDAQDDPRYYPLPKPTDLRSFSDSSDDSNDSFTYSLTYRKLSESKQMKDKYGKKCFCKNNQSDSKRRRINRDDKSNLTKSKCNQNTHGTSNQSNNRRNIKMNVAKQDDLLINRLSADSNSTSTSMKRANSTNQGAKMLELAKRIRVLGNQKTEDVVCNLNNPSPLPSFKVDDFLVLKSDKNNNYPPLWRVKEKNILQKFQHFVKDGTSLYIGLPSIVGWSAENSHQYYSVPVNIAFYNKSVTNNSNIIRVIEYPFQLTKLEKLFVDNYLKSMSHLQDSFEVFIQTLFSQALDSNFLQEIYDEKDEYFLARVRDIEGVMTDLSTKLSSLLCWSSCSLEAVSCWPSYRLSPVYNHASSHSNMLTNKPSLCSCSHSE